MRALTTISSVLVFSSSTLGACFFPNGGEAGADTACNPNAIESACCFDNQACLSNGLCVSDPKDPVKRRTHRGTCTDKDWRSGNCPRQCLSIDNNGVPVYSCNNTQNVPESFCCFDNCKCTTGFDTFSFDTLPEDVFTVTIIGDPSFTQTRPSTSTSASSSVGSSVVPPLIPAATTSAANSAAPSESQSEQSGPNTVALGAGLGIGLPVAAALLIGGFFLWRRKKRTRQGEAYLGKAHELPDEPAYYPADGPVKYAHYASTEMQGDVPLHELSSANAKDRPAVELPGHPIPAPSGPKDTYS